MTENIWLLQPLNQTFHKNQHHVIHVVWSGPLWHICSVEYNTHFGLIIKTKRSSTYLQQTSNPYSTSSCTTHCLKHTLLRGRSITHADCINGLACVFYLKWLIHWNPIKESVHTCVLYICVTVLPLQNTVYVSLLSGRLNLDYQCLASRPQQATQREGCGRDGVTKSPANAHPLTPVLVSLI